MGIVCQGLLVSGLDAGDSSVASELGPGKWPNAPLFRKWCIAPEADLRAAAKSKPYGEMTAGFCGGVERRWNSFRIADHPPENPLSTQIEA